MTFHGSIPNIVRAQIYDSYVEGTVQLNRVATPYIDNLRSHGDDYSDTISNYTWQLRGTHGRWMLEFDTDDDAVSTFLHALESTHGAELVSDRSSRAVFHGHVFFERMMASRRARLLSIKSGWNAPSLNTLMEEVAAGHVVQPAI